MGVDQLEIGRLGRPHGLHGEILATITSDRPERTAAGAVWILDHGQVTVEAARPHQQRWIVALSGFDTREQVGELAGQLIRAEPIEDPDALWVHELIGAEVHTPDGRGWGRVRAIVANPADDLLELDDGTLIPSGFVSDGSALPDRVVVDVPDGLLGGDL